MPIIDGKQIANVIKEDIANEVRKMLSEGRKAPHLAAILVGENIASQTYVANKEKACKEVGFISTVYRLPENVTERELLDIINFVNKDNEIDGLIVQMPLPEHINSQTIIESILPSKDVDGFHPLNIGRMITNMPTYIPATPLGIVTLLEKANIDIEGKHCVILGRSNIVGTPLSILLSRKSKNGNATVTLCHSKTLNIEHFTLQADILIAAVGKPLMVKAEMVKEGSVIIDVGIHRIEDENKKYGFKLVGDVDFNEVYKKCSYITPVPGGVGPMTIVGLLINTLKAAKKEIYP